jgi:hypothetical protein
VERVDIKSGEVINTESKFAAKAQMSLDATDVNELNAKDIGIGSDGLFSDASSNQSYQYL